MPLDKISYMDTLERMKTLIDKLNRHQNAAEENLQPMGNSLTPDDRLFLAYLAARIEGAVYDCHSQFSTPLETQERAVGMCKNYKKQKKCKQ